MSELVVARVAAGVTRLRLPLGGRRRTFYFVEPGAVDRLRAVELYGRAYRRARKDGLPTFDETVALLKEQRTYEFPNPALDPRRWSDQEDARLVELAKRVDALKIRLYEGKDEGGRRPELTRAELAETRAELDALHLKRNALYGSTCEAAATAARLRFWVGTGLRRADAATPVWRGSFWKSADALLDDAVAAVLRLKPTAAEVRLAARTEPWRSTWAAREACHSLFGRDANALTDDQRALVAWTRIYDNARDDPDGPGEAAVADDDLFDGWMLTRRKPEKDPADKLRRVTSNDKILGADHVFVTADAWSVANGGDWATSGDAVFTDETADAVMAMNSPHAMETLRAKLAAADKAGGEITEKDTPDNIWVRKMAANAGRASA